MKFGAKVAAQEGYIPPEQYNQDFLLMPEDFSDVGQAIVLSREYMDRLRFSPATDYIVFNDSFWEESQPNAQGIAQELTARQLEEAETEIQRCMKEMSENGAWAMLAAMGAKKAMAAFSEAQRHSFEKYERAETYRKYAIKRRDTKYISAALKEARPMIQIEQRVLDADEFLLNLPSGTCDLRTGAVREHNAQDYITKQTAVDPSGDGMDVWEDALQTFFQGDADLIRYVQEIVGLAAIGKVYIEALVIAYGEGRNGKSTFWNTIARVLGTYSGNMSADTLTVGCKRNVKPELAEAKGKRMIIAAELEEGMRLNTSNVKQLCSTDEIYAEKKYKAPFSYVPTHTLVLYTNHLPRVGAIDQGTWRRLIVIPFNAKIEGKADIKNYADFLFKTRAALCFSGSSRAQSASLPAITKSSSPRWCRTPSRNTRRTTTGWPTFWMTAAKSIRLMKQNLVRFTTLIAAIAIRWASMRGAPRIFTLPLESRGGFHAPQDEKRDVDSRIPLEIRV